MRTYSDSVPEGTVISVLPAAGSTVERGSSVSVEVSRGPELVAVPSIAKAKSIAQAVAKAEAEARSPVPTGITPSYSTPQYPPLSQQTQPSATDFLQQPGPPPAARPAPRHGANEG